MTPEERARLIAKLKDQELDLSYRDSVLIIANLRRIDAMEKAMEMFEKLGNLWIQHNAMGSPVFICGVAVRDTAREALGESK